MTLQQYECLREPIVRVSLTLFVAAAALMSDERPGGRPWRSQGARLDAHRRESPPSKTGMNKQSGSMGG